MLLAVTSSSVWWFLRPLTAAYIAGIMGGTCPFSPRPPQKGPAVACGVSGAPRSCDDGGVDVGEDLGAHMRFVERGDHGAVRHGDDEGVVVDHHHRGARAFAGGEVDPVFQSFDGLRVFG